MSSEQRATTIPQTSGSKVSRESALYWLGCIALYSAVLTLYAQSLHYAPLSLDDQSQLLEVSELPLRATQRAEWCAAGHGLAIAGLETGQPPAQVLVLVERLSVDCPDPELTQLRELLR